MVQMTAKRRPQPSTWPAYGAFIGALVYGAMKVDLALKGQVGIAGFPNRPGHEQDQGGQWGNVAVAVVCAAVALATVQPWGRSIPRWLLLAASWAICAGLGAGAVALVLRVLGRSELPAPTGWTGRLVAAAAVVWVVLWGATAVSYRRRTRGRSRPRAE
jgi:hypothetical protein